MTANVEIRRKSISSQLTVPTFPISAGAQRTSQVTSHSESEPCVELNLTPSAHRGKYSADVVGEITRCIFEDGVSVPSQGKRTLRVARDCKIRMIEQIVSFGSKCNLRAFRQFEGLLQGHIKLRERGSSQDVTSSSSKLARLW